MCCQTGLLLKFLASTTACHAFHTCCSKRALELSLTSALPAVPFPADLAESGLVSDARRSLLSNPNAETCPVASCDCYDPTWYCGSTVIDQAFLDAGNANFHCATGFFRNHLGTCSCVEKKMGCVLTPEDPKDNGVIAARVFHAQIPLQSKDCLKAAYIAAEGCGGTGGGKLVGLGGLLGCLHFLETCTASVSPGLALCV